MRITFVLPGFRQRPVGGFLVVYRYANELASRSHDVSIVHPRRIATETGFGTELKSITWRGRKKVRYVGRPPWFPLDSRVASILVRDLTDENSIPPGDAIFATACNTALPVMQYSAQKGTKLYLIQHYEDWICGKDGVEATWRLPMHKVVSSRWLLEIGVALAEEGRLTHIPYGVETGVFRVRIPPAERSEFRVGMLAHQWPFKGMAYGVEALAQVRAEIPELQPLAFGAHSRPPGLPDWIRYVENPSRQALAELYNSFSIFMHTSVTEGWGLTGAEALACGCALAAADSGGVKDYAIDGETAMLVPPRDAAALADCVIRLIQDRSLRLELANRGHAFIQAFTWSRAAAALEHVVSDLLDGERRQVTAADQP
jgi:glycosyltransferase involved in cell wall biosynthesis